MPSVGPLELGIVFLVAILVFGPKRLPELGRSTGRGIREFRQSVSGAGETLELSDGPSDEPSREPNRAAATVDP
jgi:sec-independent protein translocase protein TatA